MSWTDEKVAKLKELWGRGKTANQIAEIIGGISRNAVIGKAHRLNLSAKIKTRAATSNQNFENSQDTKNIGSNRSRKNRFKSLIIEKDFEPENPKQLEELDEKSLKDFSYCKLHLLYAYQPKNKKDGSSNKDKEEVPEFIEKKVHSA